MPSANFVFPVRYVSEGVAVQTTSRDLSPLGIAVRSLAPPPVGARVSMALYLPNSDGPEVAIGRVSVARAGPPAESGFWADFLVVDSQARMRIITLLSEHDLRSKHTRACARIPVRIRVRFRSTQDFVQEYSVNLSRGGIFIATDDPPALDSVVEVELQLPDSGTPVTSAGIVVHRQLPVPGKLAGVGVQFVDASDPFREMIDRYMDSLPKA